MGFWNKIKKTPLKTNSLTSSTPVQPKNSNQAPSITKPSPSHNSTVKSKLPTLSPNMINSLTHKVLIKRLALIKSEDFSLLRQNLLDGNIMIVNMQALVDGSQDQIAIHNQINWLKQYCVQSGGSVAKLKENLFLVTPNNHVKVENQFNNNN